MEEITDTTPMPWGKHKGAAMANIDADYLLWVRENLSLSTPMQKYIDDNRVLLEKEAATGKSRKRDEPINRQDRDAELERFNRRK